MSLGLLGCAAQTAYREGNALLAQGRGSEGLAKLEEASRLEPGSAEYRVAYLQSRDRYAQALIERADVAARASKYDEAERGYREALLIRAQQDRAVTGLRQLNQQRRWDAALKDSEQAVARKDFDGARSKLKVVLMESPRHGAATKLLEQIEQQTVKPRVEPALSSAYKQPISLEFRDVPLRSIFEVISRTSRLNFLFDKEIKTDQRTSIYLRNSTVEAAVNWLLLTNQLDQRVLDGSTVLIYPSSAAKQSEYQPLTVKSFYLANADAKSVAGTLKSLLKSKDVVVDEKLNLVIMRDSTEAIRLAEKLVALHDVPEPEVMLEVEILEVKRDRLLDLGVRWPDQISLSVLPSIVGGTLTLQDLRNPTQSMVGVTVGSASVIAKKQDSDANLLANPRIRVRNREKAKILIGERLPNITTTSTATGFVAESVNYVDVGLKLEVEPSIYLDNEVAIKVALEVSSITSQQTTKAGSVAYQLGTRNAQTVLRLKDGENQVLAGLINNEERRTASKIPGLGELPIAGRLFGDQGDNSSRTEIVLSITPRILRNIQRPDATVLEFAAGTETSLRGWPSDAGAAPTAPGVAVPAPGSAQAAAVGSASQSPPVLPVPPVGMPTGGPSSSPAPAPAALVTTTSGVVPGSTQLRWEGPTRVRAGETFSVQLTMQSEQQIVSLPMVLGFDPKLLQVVSVSEGSFLKEGGAQTTFAQRIDPAGQVTITMARGQKGTGATSPGVVATLTLRALPTASATETRLQVVSLAATGVSGQSLSMPVPAGHVLSFIR